MAGAARRMAAVTGLTAADGRTVYVLEQVGGIANIALVNPATKLVEKVLPAPGTCVQVLVSPDGGHLYEVVRTAGTGSIQVAAA